MVIKPHIEQGKEITQGKAHGENLFFKISSGLKKVIGQDLIISDFVAIFELVKNSFDAHSSLVHVVIDESNIWIIDNGKGMSSNDIVNKWLFVAYSAKKDGLEDADYRARAGKGVFAGNKGVGRFSCDRLGAHLTLQTRRKKTDQVSELFVDWDRFDKDSKEEFVKIPVKLSSSEDFMLPKGAQKISSGTVLKVSMLRDSWDREKLITLRTHLSKLINPFDERPDGFAISLSAPQEQEEDKLLTEKALAAEEDKKQKFLRRVVNGRIGNFVFSDLKKKTTVIAVTISSEGVIRTELVDRGLVIYVTEEQNPYGLLKKASFSCEIYYLNQSAKNTFARRTGVSSVAFGSIFLFKNGFRVFPIGEEGNDTFELDRNKQQGYARKLGTREVVGRIDVQGDDELFREASSRDQGLINTKAYQQLKECFVEKCLKRLERYVVDVTWKDALDKLREDPSGLQSAPARARIISLVSNLAGSRDIRLISYNREIVNILSDKVDEFEGSLDDLKKFARSTGDTALAERVANAEIRYKELKEAEARARESAEAERAAREAAEREASAAKAAALEKEAERDQIKSQLAEERKRNLFLASVSSLDVDTITNLHHQVIICASNVHELIEGQLEKLSLGGGINKESLFGFLEQIRLKNQQILAIARMATKANFRMESNEISADVISYVSDYAKHVSSAYQKIRLIISETDDHFERMFHPIGMSIVIDNLIFNARKANAKTLSIEFEVSASKALNISFVDDGDGLSTSLKSEPDRIFEKGVSTTDGSGLGLYHVRQIVESWGGQILFSYPSARGAKFTITLPKK